MNLISDQFKKIVLSRCGIWYSKVGDLSLKPTDISLLFSFRDAGEHYDLVFSESHRYEKVKDYDFEDVMGKEVMNKIEQSVPNVISTLLAKLCEGRKIDYDKINVFAVPYEGGKHVNLALYDGDTFVEWLSLDDMVAMIMS